LLSCVESRWWWILLPRSHLVERLQRATRDKTKFDLLDHQGCTQQQTKKQYITSTKLSEYKDSKLSKIFSKENTIITNNYYPYSSEAGQKVFYLTIPSAAKIT
jgi:hypothetical protein